MTVTPNRSFRLPTPVLEALVERATEQGRAVNDVVRRILVGDDKPLKVKLSKAPRRRAEE